MKGGRQALTRRLARFVRRSASDRAAQEGAVGAMAGEVTGGDARCERVASGRGSWRSQGLVAGALLLVGLSQMFGDLAGLPALKGLASATMLSPAPKVFSTVKGLETFSTSFTLEWEAPDGQTRVMPVTQARYRRLEGPYNRRNAYGAALAYGPVLATSEVGQGLLGPVSRFGLCGEAPVLAELGVPPSERGERLVIHYVPREGMSLTEVPDRLEVDCRDREPGAGGAWVGQMKGVGR